MSKLNQEQLLKEVEDILKYSQETKKRNFIETVELQIGIKNYDVTRDKRFAGTVILPNVCKPKLRILVIADQKHVYECEEQNIEFIDVVPLPPPPSLNTPWTLSCPQDGLKKFKKNKKAIKKWGTPHLLSLSPLHLISLPCLRTPISLPRLIPQPRSMTASLRLTL